MAVVIVYASTIVIITWIIARAVGSLTGTVNFRHAIDVPQRDLRRRGPGDANSTTDDIVELLRRGLPLVADVIPADQVAVFARNGRVGRFTPLVAWPGDQDDVADLAELPELDQALRADAVVLDAAYCAIPVGYCTDGELVMVVERPESTVGSTGRPARRPSSSPPPSCG